MSFVTRDDDGQITGVYRRLQTVEGSMSEPLFPQEEIADDDPELIGPRNGRLVGAGGPDIGLAHTECDGHEPQKPI